MHSWYMKHYGRSKYTNVTGKPAGRFFSKPHTSSRSSSLSTYHLVLLCLGIILLGFGAGTYLNRSQSTLFSEPVTLFKTFDVRSLGTRSRPPQAGDQWQGCNAARAAGTAPIYADEPGYGSHMDGDNDGVACEPYRGG